ncbi:MAG: transpeptidase family protein [Bacteroidales bacterium]|nr:transpeptidase family protein [Bacteroidales bacterium]
MNNSSGDISRRLLPLFVALFLFFVLPIMWNLIKLQFIDGAEWRSRAKNTTIKWRDVKAQRGTIYSADGKMLATSLPVYDIIIDLGKEKVDAKSKHDDSVKTKSGMEYYRWIISKETFNRCLPALCDSMARLFPDKTPNDYYQFFTKERNRQNRYCYIKKGVSFYQKKRMQAFPMLMVDTTINKPKRNKKFTPEFCRAIIPTSRDIRIHPYGDMARHTIGFLRNTGDSMTFNGLEGYYDKYLRGQQGQRWERFLARVGGENVWIPFKTSDQKRAVDGQDIVSTIDTRLQELAYNSLYKCVSENQADLGCVILMEVQTGYVRAISSLQYVDSVRGYAEMNNQACVNSYEPGSTFKTATNMVLLESGKCDTLDSVPRGTRIFMEDCTGSNPNPKRYKVLDSDTANKGKITMKRAFEVSSNVGTCYPVWQNYRNNRDEFRSKLVSVLPMNCLGLDLDLEEPKPYIVKDLSQPIDFLNLCYGYVARFTPLQMLTFYNAIANKGKMVKPLFCSEIRQGNDVVKKMEPIVIKEKICSDKTLAILNDFLVGVVENGTARHSLSKTPYGIAGKTGTTQLNYTRRGTEGMRYCASFAGYFPADNPQYSCIVVIFNPKQGSKYGGELAAPVFKDLADRVCGTFLNMDLKIKEEGAPEMPYIKKGLASDINGAFRYLGIRYLRTDTSSSVMWLDAEKDANGRVLYRPYTLPEGKVPNCKGMTAKDAVFMLEKMGFSVAIEGRGKVVSQSLRQNQPYKKGDKILLTLRPEAPELPTADDGTTTQTKTN